MAAVRRDGSIADLHPWPTSSELVSLESPFENSVVPDEEFALHERMFDDLVNTVPASNEDVSLTESHAWEENCDRVVYAVQKLQQQQSSTRFTPAYAGSACNDYSFRNIGRSESPLSVYSAPGTLERHPFTEIARGHVILGQDVGQLGTNRDEQPIFKMKARKELTVAAHQVMEPACRLPLHVLNVARLGVGPCTVLYVRLEITVGEFHQPQMHFQFLVRNCSKPE
ncbi:hypothetical protein NW762_003595 [Fusarium torreyae]|uniref:Uncharacterized protein n=1 Tax=Fusarium torreyae TaxID=1237075 RepID=A0A9W8SAK7_9HYPO|nr:hypothetical protein NW762_003595 [Fusarium torreyae]